jgi:outer membrane receptor for ferrienterochelin and colicins
MYLRNSDARRWRLLLIASTLCCISHARGSSEEDLLLSFGEEEFLSIATGQKQLIAKAPAVASVITAEDIEARGANTLEEALEAVPGMHISLSSTYLSPIYSIRGVYTDKNPQVLMLVNGVPITQLHFGDRGGRPNLPVRDIARIEVIRGPGSAVYGADALSGVINVITKTAEQIGGTQVGVRAASFDTTEGWLLHGGKWGDLEIAFSLQAQQTDGDDSRRIGSDFQSLFDAAAAPFGFPAASHAPGSFATATEALDVRLDVKYDKVQLRFWNARQDDLGVGPGLALALDPDGNADIDNYLVDLAYVDSELITNGVLELRASYMDVNVQTEQTLFPPGTLLPIGADGNINPAQFVPMLFAAGYIGNPEFYEQHARAEAIFTYNGIANHSLRFAGGATRQEEKGKESKNYGPGVLDLESRQCAPPICVVGGTLVDVSDTPFVYIEDQDRDVYYASIQDQWQFANDWSLTVGVRYEDYSDFGSTVNPRAALVWEVDKDLTAKLLYGHAFRAPAFVELFAINNPVAIGNPNLDPETTNTYELAFDYRASFDWRIGFNIFYYDTKDLIDFVPTPLGFAVADNVGRQRGKGFEIETEWEATETLTVIANYAWQNAKDKELDKDAARSPEQQAYLRASWTLPDAWSLTGEFKWVADRNREAFDPRDTIDDYTITNLNIRKSGLFDHLDVGLRVRNLFNQNAAEPSPFEAVPAGSLIPDDFPLEERSVHLTAQIHF